MANEKNLIPNSERTPSERRENAKKAGIASGKTRRRKKCLKDTVNMLLALPIKEGKLDLLSSLSTIDDKNITIEEKLILKQIDKAAKGDPRAFETLIGIISERSASAAGINESAGSNAGSSFVEALNDKAAEVWNEETTGAV